MGRSDRIRTLVVLAGLAPLALGVACNLITGVGQYQNVDCAPSDCPDASEASSLLPPEAGTAPDAREAGTASDADASPPADVQVDALPSPNDTLRWARWRMPNPHDAGVDTNLSSYAGDDAGAVTDNMTRLVWDQATSAAGTFEDAYAYCATRTLGPFTWRLPTRIELASLVDWTRTPAIDPTAFPDATGGPYWTWSAVAGTDGGLYWVVDFDDGTVKSSASPSTVRCVRPGP
jgi:hypothetical protein